MKRVVVINQIEPGTLNVRNPAGLPFTLDIEFRDQTGVVMDPAQYTPVLLVTKRSDGSCQPYEAALITGLARIALPAMDDPSGYSIELYAGTPPIAPLTVPTPNWLMATGWLSIRASGIPEMAVP